MLPIITGIRLSLSSSFAEVVAHQPSADRLCVWHGPVMDPLTLGPGAAVVCVPNEPERSVDRLDNTELNQLLLEASNDTKRTFRKPTDRPEGIQDR